MPAVVADLPTHLAQVAKAAAVLEQITALQQQTAQQTPAAAVAGAHSL
jgi:hypothetical protein